MLSLEVEIDQQVAAEHKVIRQVMAEQRRIEQVADLKSDLLVHPLRQLIAVIDRGEIALTKINLLAAK